MPDLSMTMLLEKIARYVGKLYTNDARGIDADIYRRGPDEVEFVLGVVADEVVSDARIPDDTKKILEWAEANLPYDKRSKIEVAVTPVLSNVVDVRITIKNNVDKIAPWNDDLDL